MESYLIHITFHFCRMGMVYHYLSLQKSEPKLRFKSENMIFAEMWNSTKELTLQSF